jgi:hypothetical protein
MSRGPQVFIEVRPSAEGCHARARIEGAPDRLARTFTGVFASRDEAISGAARWALAWLRKVRRGGLVGEDDSRVARRGSCPAWLQEEE